MDVRDTLKKLHKECIACNKKYCDACDNRKQIFDIIHSRPFGVTPMRYRTVSPRDMNLFLCRYRHRIKTVVLHRDKPFVGISGHIREPKKQIEIPSSVRYNMLHPFSGGRVSPK